MFYEIFFFFFNLCDYSYFQAFLGSTFYTFESKIRQKNYLIVEQKRNKKSFEKPYEDLFDCVKCEY
jgi:hypothetical protein